MRPITARATVANPQALIRLDPFHGAALGVQVAIETGSGSMIIVTPTTWNPSDKGAACTLSNGNLTATWVATGAGARSVDSETSSKFYFEVTANAVVSNLAAGIANSSQAMTGALANTANVLYARLDSGGIFGNAVTQGNVGAALTAGQVGRFAVDLGAKLFWYAAAGGNWNGNAANNPATGVGGISFSYLTGPYFAYTGSGPQANQVTANFGASAFAYSVPSGFGAGWGIAPPANVYAIDYSFDDPCDLVNPVPAGSMAWDNSLLPSAAQAGASSMSFVIPTAPVWIRLRLLSGTNPVRAVFTQYSAHHSTQVAKMPPSQFLQLPQDVVNGA